MYPTQRRASKESETTSWPAMVTVPAVGPRKPARTRSVVLLPAPLGPRKPTTSPLPISNDTSSTATCAP